MKKIAIILLIVVCALSFSLVFTGCKSYNNESIDVTILAPDGAPALAIAKLMKEQPSFDGYKINYKILNGGASDVSAKMISGEGNIAIIPTNLASILYNKTDAKCIATNVQGLLYLVGGVDVDSLEDLVGSVVYNIGQGATPDLTFKYLLNNAHIEYAESDIAVPGKVALTYVSSGAELIPLLKQGKAQFGILGEPAVTKACSVAGVSVIFDIQELWMKATDSVYYGYPQTSLIVAKSLQNDKNKTFLKWIVEKLEENDAWILTNASEAGQILADNGSASINSTLESSVVARCHIGTTFAMDAKSQIETYLGVLYGFNPSSIGGKMPDEDFYFEVR